jgi:hypothetical protein
MTAALEDHDLKTVTCHRPSTDHPVWTEPSPRRVRAFLDGTAVADSTRALADGPGQAGPALEPSPGGGSTSAAR